MDKKEFGERILYYLKIKSINQKDFAKLCDLNETTLSRYISGEREPKASVIMKMASILSITTDELLGMEQYLIKKYISEIN